MLYFYFPLELYLLPSMKFSMICWSIAAIAVRSWRPEKFENPENRDFGNLKHLQNWGLFFYD